MANVEAVQVYVDAHHNRCVRALQVIAELGDTGSNQHKATFAAYYSMGEPPAGWRVAEAMRIVATDALGEVPKEPKGFWIELSPKGGALDVVEGGRYDHMPGYKWFQEVKE